MPLSYTQIQRLVAKLNVCLVVVAAGYCEDDGDGLIPILGLMQDFTFLTRVKNFAVPVLENEQL